MTLKTISAATILSGAILAGLAGPAPAVPAQAGRGPARVADAGQPPPAAAAEDEATCNTSRKRLWVEGEGWIVRRVTICR